MTKATIWSTILIPLIAIAWIFIPITVPIPWFFSPFISALTEEAKLQPTTEMPDETAAIEKFIPAGSKTEDVGAQEAARFTRQSVPGEKYRHYKTCQRITRLHPLGRFGWQVDLFCNSNGIIESAKASLYYDGL